MQGSKLSITSLTLLLFCTLIWASTFPFLKLGLDYIKPITFATLRFIIACIPVMLFLALKYGKEIFKHSKGEWSIFISFGFFSIAFPSIIQNYGMLHTTASVSSILQTVGPVLTIILAIAILREPFGWKKRVGAVLAMVGAFMIATEGGITFQGATVYGNVLQLLTAFSYAISGIIAKIALKRQDPVVFAGTGIFTGTLLLIPPTFIEPVGEILILPLKAWAIVIYLGTISGVLPFVIWYIVLQKQELSKQVYFVFLIPVFATMMSYFMIGEKISVLTAVFTVLIILGIAIAQFEKAKPKRRE